MHCRSLPATVLLLGAQNTTFSSVTCTRWRGSVTCAAALPQGQHPKHTTKAAGHTPREADAAAKLPVMQAVRLHSTCAEGKSHPAAQLRIMHVRNAAGRATSAARRMLQATPDSPLVLHSRSMSGSQYVQPSAILWVHMLRTDVHI